MKNICSISTWRHFKKSGLIDCGYIEFAVWIPVVLWSENFIYLITGKDFHWSDIKTNKK